LYIRLTNLKINGSLHCETEPVFQETWAKE
jgi:hypothetical protein